MMDDMKAPETEIVTQWRVSCDGGGGALGHPKVWLSIAPEIGFVECGYCDKRFVIKEGMTPGGH
ncbi:MAG: zinc-finger domain-containing protein [Deltaproteobacteria bacterium]